jgi:hypothetical protein
MRSLIIASALALCASQSFAGTGGPGWASRLNSTPTGNVPAGPYNLDDKGKCHAANGNLAPTNLCAAPATTHCRDPNTGRSVRCETPRAAPG